MVYCVNAYQQIYLWPDTSDTGYGKRSVMTLSPLPWYQRTSMVCQYIIHRQLWAKRYDTHSFNLIPESQCVNTSDTGYGKRSVMPLILLTWYQRVNMSTHQTQATVSEALCHSFFQLDTRESVCQHIRHRLLWAKRSFNLIPESQCVNTSDTGYCERRVVTLFPLPLYYKTSVMGQTQ